MCTTCTTCTIFIVWSRERERNKKNNLKHQTIIIYIIYRNMSLSQLKELAFSNNVKLGRPSGKWGGFIRKDYLMAINRYDIKIPSTKATSTKKPTTSIRANRLLLFLFFTKCFAHIGANALAALLGYVVIGRTADSDHTIVSRCKFYEWFAKIGANVLAALLGYVAI